MDRPFDYLSTNVTGTLRLLDHCRIHGIPHFVFASSSSVSDILIRAEMPCAGLGEAADGDARATVARASRPESK